MTDPDAKAREIAAAVVQRVAGEHNPLFQQSLFDEIVGAFALGQSSPTPAAEEHAHALRREEELGYARGLKDARSESEAKIEARENLCRQVSDNYANKTAEAEAEVALLREVARTAQLMLDHGFLTAPLRTALAALTPAPPETEKE